jgi:shikimate dehydrogenase
MSLTHFPFSRLSDWQHTGVSLGLIGNPVSHSISPNLHNAALATLSKKDPKYKDWKYAAITVEPKDLTQSLPALFKAGFCGLNVTMPYKRELCNHPMVELDPIAQQMGSVNTLIRHGTKWLGKNTDGLGLEMALKHDFKLALSGQNVVIIGLGGVANSTVVQCINSGVRSIGFYSYKPNQISEFIEKFNPLAESKKVHLYSVHKSAPRENYILINTTPAGMSASDRIPYPLGRINNPSYVFDVIYTRNHNQTRLLGLSRQLDIPATDGKHMLLYQAAFSLSLWTNQSPQFSVMQTALNNALKAKR